MKTFEQYIEDNEATIFFKDGKYVLEYLNSYAKSARDLVNTHVLLEAPTFGELKKKVEYKIYDESENRFYLEISGRQTGKTTRLIRAMKNHIDHGGNCIVFCMNYKMFTLICELLRESKYINHVYYYKKVDPVYEIKNVKNFFDEFDFIDDLKTLKYFDERGYYCTSPCKVRDFGDFQKPEKLNNDLLLQLIAYSGFNYESRKNTNISDELGENEQGKVFKNVKL